MAINEGRREVVKDPLAPNPREQRPDRSLQTAGVRAPVTPSDASLTSDTGLTRALQGVEGLLAQEFERKKDEWITEGKVAYQSGVTEQEMLATGNKFTAQGYHTLQARDQVNQWYTQQSIALEETDKQIDPQTYAGKMKEQRSSILQGITDPHARKVAAAAFEDMSPRLAQSHAVKNNEFNRQERVRAFGSTLYSTAPTSATASQRAPGDQLALAPTPVLPVMQPSARDRDVGIRTLLGEAANEGAEGMASVAHVLRNRTGDGRWPNSIAGVALQEKQFSAWNAGAGGNSLVSKYGPGHPLYERAGQVFDAVMSGRHVDPTGGATHYYSPAGMQALVSSGAQSNVIPNWLDEETERGGGRVKIGGHIFVGKASDAPVRLASAPQTATTLASGTDGDINAVAQAEGVGETGIAAAKGPNEVQQLINGYAGLNNQDKATAVADAMRRGMDAGDDSLFRDAGGFGMLHKLGAKPSEVDEVIKARKRFEDKQQTDFNVDRELYRNDILKRAEAGEDVGSLLADIDSKVKSGELNDTNARALAHSAADKVRQQSGEKSKLANPDMLNELGGLYQQIATGGDFKTMAEEGKRIADKYGATERDVQQIVGKMFSDSQSYQNRLRNETKAAAKTKLEQDGIKAEVSRALSQNYGLSTITGSVKVVNDHGQETTVSAQEYGMMQIKDKWSKQYADAVAANKMSVGQAKTELERKVLLEMQQHGVVDKQTQSQITAGVTGNIAGPDGLKQSAVAAYDTWLTLKTTEGITPAYLAKLVPDNDARTLLETAFRLDALDLSKDQALLKAHEILNDPTRDPEDRIKKDVVWRQKLDVDLKQALLERAHPGFFATIFGTADRSEQDRMLANNKTAENYVRNRAEDYHFLNPHEHGEVSLEKAIQDFQRDAVPVMGNIVITKPGKELDKKMGVQGFGPTAANDAISSYIRKNGARIWGKSYTDREPSMVGSALDAVRSFDSGFSPQGIARAIAPGTFDSPDNYKDERPKAPPVHIMYNAESGIMSVDLWKDSSMRQTIGQQKHFKVKSIGAEYVKEQTTPGSWAKTWNSMFKGTVRTVKDVLE